MRTLSSRSRYVVADTQLDAQGRESFTVPLAKGKLVVTAERLYVVTKQDEMRPDNIAYKALQDPSLWWAVCQYNNVKDPYTLREGDNLRIPTFTIAKDIKAGGPPPRDRRIYDLVSVAPPKYQTDLSDDQTTVEANTSFLYNFTVPSCLTGRVHFELQVAVDPDYTEILMGRVSVTSLERWSYYDQSGGYKPWPAAGLDGATNGGAPALFRVMPTDPLVAGGVYYFRIRPWVDDAGIMKYGKWKSEAVRV